MAGGRAGLRLDPRAARAPERRAPGRPRDGHQREDDDDPTAHGGARRDRRRRREQRDRLQHAARATSPRWPGPRRPEPCSRPTRSTCRACSTATAAADGGAAEPLARSARPDERGAHDRRQLAGRAGGGAAHARGGQRRRSARGVGGRRGTRRALGGCRPALAARCRRLPLLRGPHHLRRGRLVLRRLRLRPSRPRGDPRRRAGRHGPRPSGPTGGRRPSGWRCPGGSTRPTR